MPNEVLSLLGVLAVVAVILVLAYWSTKLIARSGSLMLGGKNGANELKVLRQLNVGRNEKLLLVQLHQRGLLLGVTGSNISLLTELTDEELNSLTQTDATESCNIKFADVLKRGLSKRK